MNSSNRTRRKSFRCYVQYFRCHCSSPSFKIFCTFYFLCHRNKYFWNHFLLFWKLSFFDPFSYRNFFKLLIESFSAKKLSTVLYKFLGTWSFHGGLYWIHEGLAKPGSNVMNNTRHCNYRLVNTGLFYKIVSLLHIPAWCRNLFSIHICMYLRHDRLKFSCKFSGK